LPRGGGGGLRGTEDAVRESELRFEQEEEEVPLNGPLAPRDQNPPGVQSTSPEGMVPRTPRWEGLEVRTGVPLPAPQDFLPDEGSPKLTINPSIGEGKINLAGVLTALAVPFFTSQLSSEAPSKEVQNGVPRQR
jgi:hypothetical protein